MQSQSPHISNEIHPNQPPARLLIIRLSSFGDIIQAIGVPAAFRAQHPEAPVDWLVREDFSGLLQGHPEISQVISFSRQSGLRGLIRLAWHLSSEPYTHLYDAHNNVRSRIFCAVFRFRRLLNRPLMKAQPFRFARRPKNRLRRWMMFRLRMPTLPRPFRGADSFHRPLRTWGLRDRVPSGAQFHPQQSLPNNVLDALTQLPRPVIALAPSAAWEMKRWPVEHWKTLVQALAASHGLVFLGGPQDLFIADMAAQCPKTSLNLAGRLTLQESCSVLQHVDLLVANDTGLLHAADQMERPAIALIGPTALGYPSHASSSIVEIDLPCKPCSKDGSGHCRNSLYQRCLVELSPVRVRLEIDRILKGGSQS